MPCEETGKPDTNVSVFATIDLSADSLRPEEDRVLTLLSPDVVMRGVVVINGLGIEVLNWRKPVLVLRDGVAFLETCRDLKTLCSVDISTRLTDELGSMTKILLFNDNHVGSTERRISL